MESIRLLILSNSEFARESARIKSILHKNSPIDRHVVAVRRAACRAPLLPRESLPLPSGPKSAPRRARQSIDKLLIYQLT